MKYIASSLVGVVLSLMCGSCSSNSIALLKDTHSSYDSVLLREFGFTDTQLKRWPELLSVVKGYHIYEGDAKHSFIATPHAVELMMDAIEHGDMELGRYVLLLFLATRDGEAAEVAFERDITEYKGELRVFRRIIGCPQGVGLVGYLKVRKNALRQSEVNKASLR